MRRFSFLGIGAIALALFAIASDASAITLIRLTGAPSSGGVFTKTIVDESSDDLFGGLAEYGELWEVDDNVWKLLTGDQSDILRVASAYGVWYEATDEGTYRHPMYTLVLFPDGSLHEVLLGSTWDADTVAALLRQMADDLEVAPR